LTEKHTCFGRVSAIRIYDKNCVEVNYADNTRNLYNFNSTAPNFSECLKQAIQILPTTIKLTQI
jgi:hypothetical protein